MKILFLTILICFTACDSVKLVPSISVSGEIASQSQKEGAVIRFADLTDFEWDMVYIFGPYTPAAEVRKLMGFEWPDYKKFNLESSDTFNLIVFTKRNQVVRVEQHPRSQGDFAPASVNQSFSKSSAIFKVSKENNWIVLKPEKRH